jgi:hypothetical protein
MVNLRILCFFKTKTAAAALFLVSKHEMLSIDKFKCHMFLIVDGIPNKEYTTSILWHQNYEKNSERQQIHRLTNF